MTAVFAARATNSSAPTAEGSRSPGQGIFANASSGEFSWTTALSEIAMISGSDHACLWRFRDGRLFYVGSADFASRMKDVPREPSPFYTSSLAPNRVDGFTSDADHSVQARLCRDPYFQEVMVPRDLRWRAACLLLEPGGVDGLRLIVWRSTKRGPYTPADLKVLDTIVEPCRLAALLTKTRLESLATKEASNFDRRAEATFMLDAFGRVKAMNAAGGAILRRRDLLLIHDKLTSNHASERARIAKSISAVLSAPYKAGAVVLSGLDTTKRFRLLLLPVLGEAQGVFDTSCAIAVLLDLERFGSISERTTLLLRASFDLTERETVIAIMIAQGKSLGGIAETLGISEGTTRNHLKNTLKKAGVHSQSELVSLIGRLD